MKVVLVRHAHAGSREAWGGDDRDRPLSAKGERQAAFLVPVLSGFAPGRILSSPAVRCLQTVAPTATLVGRDVEPVEALAEGHADEAVALVERLTGGTVVVCTHGDVASALLEACRTGPVIGPPIHMGKAEVRLLRRRSGAWTAEGPFSLSGEVAPPVV